MSVSYVFEILISGIVTGCCYALVGAGLSLIWGTLDMVNLAHGEYYMLAAYFLWWTWTQWTLGVGLLPAIVISLICLSVLEMLIYATTIGPLVSKPGWGSSPWILTLGLSTLLQNVALAVFGQYTRVVPSFSSLILKPFSGLVTVSVQRILIIVVTAAVIISLMAVIKYTRFGRSIVATSQDAEMAETLGVNTKNIRLLTYLISAGLAAVAGFMLSPIYSITPTVGISISAKGQVVCILGGLGSVEGAIIAGAILGIAESIGVSFVGVEWKDIIGYIAFIIVLFVKPTGLFGKEAV